MLLLVIALLAAMPIGTALRFRGPRWYTFVVPVIVTAFDILVWQMFAGWPGLTLDFWVLISYLVPTLIIGFVVGYFALGKSIPNARAD